MLVFTKGTDRNSRLVSCSADLIYFLWGYYIIQLAGPDLGSRCGPKLDRCMTYHKWRILKSCSRDDVIPQPAVFVYLTFPIDEIGKLDDIQLYSLKNPISSIRNVKQKLRVRDYVVLTPQLSNASFVVGRASVQLRTTSASWVGCYRLGNVITP